MTSFPKNKDHTHEVNFNIDKRNQEYEDFQR